MKQYQADQALPCILCKRELHSYDDYSNHPSEGVCANTRGNYGSRVYDSMNGRYLEFSICDDCLIEAGDRGLIYEINPVPRGEPRNKPRKWRA